MNKFIVRLMCFIFTISCVAHFGVLADNGASVASGVLNGYGIYEGLSSDNEAITRGEAAHCIIKMTGNKPPLLSDSNISDVTDSDSYAQDIRTVKAMGWMSAYPDGSFKASQAVSTEDFIKAVLKLAGYSEYIKVRYNDQYMLAAKQLLNLNFAGNQALTKEKAYKIMKNCMLMPYCQMDSIVLGDYQYNTSEDYTVLKHYFDANRKKGIVTSVNGASLRGYEPVGNGYISVFDGKNESRYKTEESESLQLLGWEVNYYVTADDKLLYMEKSNNDGTSLELEYIDIGNISSDRTALSYSFGKKTKTADIAIDAAFIYNGVNDYNIAPEEMYDRNTELLLSDPDGDEVYEVVLIWHSQYAVVYTYDMNSEIIKINRID